jgi:hypothetical protein
VHDEPGQRDRACGVRFTPRKAECGHLLMMVTTLHDAPNGKRCEQCAAPQQSGTAM